MVAHGGTDGNVLTSRTWRCKFGLRDIPVSEVRRARAECNRDVHLDHAPCQQRFHQAGDRGVLRQCVRRARDEFVGRERWCYQTNKTHLGDEGGEAVYVHRFRAVNKAGKHVVVKMAREPDLIYDVRNEQLLFSGGSYEILREGINQ